MPRKLWIPLLLVVSIALLRFPSTSEGAASEEELGQQAEHAGNLEEAMQHYLAALQAAPENSELQQQLRKRLLNLSPKLHSPPPIPKEAKTALRRGMEELDDITSASDYIHAADKLKEALRIAPWWTEAYSKLATIQEAAGNFTEAANNLKLLADASADPSAAKNFEKGLERLAQKQNLAEKTKIEASVKEAETSARHAAAEARKAELALSSLNGIWREVKQNSEYEWRLTMKENHEFELVPVKTIGLGDKTIKTLAKEQDGFFAGTIEGNRIRGHAYSGKGVAGTCRPEIVNLRGELFQGGARLLLRYTFFVNPTDCSLLPRPVETEELFVNAH
jgi:tetratricopeptide (TPR) repeat protein